MNTTAIRGCSLASLTATGARRHRTAGRSGVRLSYLSGILLSALAAGALNVVDLPRAPQRPDEMAALPVPREQWRELKIADAPPAVLNEVAAGILQMQNRSQLPVAEIPGDAVHGKLPQTLWLKLEHPGNAFLLVETDHGKFVKVLDDASPGFISRCRIDPAAFGTFQGEPVYLARDEVKVQRMWIVQDATATANHSPGWLALSEPVKEKFDLKNMAAAALSEAGQAVSAK